MKKKLSLSTMAKKVETCQKEELDQKRMRNVRGGSWDWVESLCGDWCSVGFNHYGQLKDFERCIL